jgi:hypothetical protein
MKRGNGLTIGVIAFGVLALAGGGIGAAVWYTTSHKAAEKAALVSTFPWFPEALLVDVSKICII